MRDIISSLEGEYRRYKALAESAIEQLDDAGLTARPGDTSNSIATICMHVSGNLAAVTVGRADVLAVWNDGWNVLFATLASLDDAHCGATVTIRGQPLRVIEALHRSLAHASYHVGQIVDRAHSQRGADWRYLSIAPGGTAAYNANPSKEKPPQRGSS
jgi:hypothetical protein